MARKLVLLAVGLLAANHGSCPPSAHEAPAPATRHVPAPIVPPAPPRRETPFVEISSGGGDGLARIALGGVLVADRGNVDVFDGLRLRQRASMSENWLEGWTYEVVTGYGVGPRGDIFLLTSALVAPPPPAQGAGYLYRLDGRAWIRESVLGYFEHGLGLEAWSQDRWLVLAHDDAHPSAKFHAPGAQADLPELSPAPFDSKASAISPSDFRALPTGEVVVVGMLRQSSDPPVWFDAFEWKNYQGIDDPVRHQGAWERFVPGSAKGALEILTWNGQSLLPCCVRLRTSTEVWIAGGTGKNGGFAGRWNGQSWSFVAVDQPVRAFDVAPDGTLWLATSTRVLRGALGRTPESVPLPDVAPGEALTPEHIVAPGADDVWLTLRVGVQLKLYRTKMSPLYEPLPVSAEEADLRSQRQWDTNSTSWAPVANMLGCESPFVTIFEIAPPAGDLAYGDVARALQGRAEFAKIQFIEYAHFGDRYLGARVNDAATGTKLIAALARKKVVGGGKPAPKLVCFLPAAIRRIRFDLKAGTVASIGPP